MTKKRLLINIVSVGFAYPLILLLAAIKWPTFRPFLKDYSNLFLGVGAAYLAYCFQRRQAFLISLRELWHKCIEAKGDLIDYTHSSEPNQLAFGRAHRSISAAIDMVRAVYRNIGETKTSIGLYPFESLHDMRRSLDRLGFVEVSQNERKTEREKILQSWNAFRWSFLKEFSTPSPSHYINVRNARDPRRQPERPQNKGSA